MAPRADATKVVGTGITKLYNKYQGYQTANEEPAGPENLTENQNEKTKQSRKKSETNHNQKDVLVG